MSLVDFLCSPFSTSSSSLFLKMEEERELEFDADAFCSCRDSLGFLGDAYLFSRWKTDNGRVKRTRQDGTERDGTRRDETEGDACRRIVLIHVTTTNKNDFYNVCVHLLEWSLVIGGWPLEGGDAPCMWGPPLTRRQRGKSRVHHLVQRQQLIGWRHIHDLFALLLQDDRSLPVIFEIRSDSSGIPVNLLTLFQHWFFWDFSRFVETRWDSTWFFGIRYCYRLLEIHNDNHTSCSNWCYGKTQKVGGTRRLGGGIRGRDLWGLRGWLLQTNRRFCYQLMPFPSCPPKRRFIAYRRPE